MKDHIADNFIELAAMTPIKKIKIQDICDASKISRQTFYNHFPEKFDLLTYICVRDYSDMMQELKDVDLLVYKCSAAIKEKSFLYRQLFKISELYGWVEDWLYEQMKHYITANYPLQMFTEHIQFMLKLFIEGQSRAIQKTDGYLSDLELDQIAEKHLLHFPPELRQFFPSSNNAIE